jgi:hypothetical protein
MLPNSRSASRFFRWRVNCKLHSLALRRGRQHEAGAGMAGILLKAAPMRPAQPVLSGQFLSNPKGVTSLAAISVQSGMNP